MASASGGPLLASSGRRSRPWPLSEHSPWSGQVGFSTNGVWSREFNERTTELEAGPPGGAAPWRGCVFLIAKALREPSVLFKLVCDVSGRLESATRENIISLMRRGRNLAIIPGGFEDATLYARGKHRTAMSNRKGLVK